jgi:predicted PurR-regulated permease PerM
LDFDTGAPAAFGASTLFFLTTFTLFFWFITAFFTGFFAAAFLAVGVRVLAFFAALAAFTFFAALAAGFAFGLAAVFFLATLAGVFFFLAMSRISRLVKDAQNYAVVTKTKNIASNIPGSPVSCLYGQ